ncbi:MAG TPA: hypothetical protein VEW28_09480 [Candidatus Kapabacteria bacterium]|nr:hypothetical protein [Candidatus Kapabacteria bacterium]
MLIVFASAILFSMVKIAWPFIGDGSVFGGFMFNFQAYGTLTPQRTATPVMYLLYGIYFLYLKFSGGSPNVFFPFTLVSALSGVIFVFFALQFARKVSIGKEVNWLLFLLLMCAGGSLLFFTYMETYPLQYSFVLVYLYVSFLFVRRQAKLFMVVAIMFCCIAFHLQNLLLIPSFLFLYALRKKKERLGDDMMRSVFRFILITIPILLAIFLIAQYHPFGLFTGTAGSPFIALFRTTETAYTLFSPQHLLDIINEHLLLAGIPVCLLLGCLVYGFKNIGRSNSYIVFLLLNLFFFEAFLIGGNFEYGLARDWDVCSSIGIFIAVLSFFVYKQIHTSRQNETPLVSVLSVVAVCTIIPWIAVNVGDASSSERYKDLLETYTPIIEKHQTQVGFENLRKFYDVRGDLNNELLTEIRMIEVFLRPVQVSDLLNRVQSGANSLSPSVKAGVQTIVAQIGDVRDDSILKEEAFENIRLDKPHSGRSITLGDQFEDGIVILYRDLKLLSIDEAIAKADGFIIRHPQLPYGYELRGRLMIKFTREIEHSIPYLQKAVALDTMRPRSYLYLGMAEGTLAQDDLAKQHFRAMLHLDSVFSGGLVTYVTFITGKRFDISDTIDLHFIRQLLAAIIETPPESSLDVHREEQEGKARFARDLLGRIEQREREVGLIQ